MNARPVTQAGSDRPERKKSLLVRVSRLMAQPTPSTKAKHGDHDVSASRAEILAMTGMPASEFDRAADIAMASGDIDEAEDKLLEAMQRLLGIDDAFAGKVIEVLQTKYTV